MTREHTQNRQSHLFGPVVSRRLGRSLGIDIVPHKVCTLDCIYCEVGHTDRLTSERREYVPADTIAAEVGARLAAGLEADYLTVTGSGEPTLNSAIGTIITRLKQVSRIPVAVLTNGTLLGDPQVRRDLAEADLVLPSLDAGTPEEYQAVNHPARGLTLEALVEGMVGFRRGFTGQVWLEVLLVGGITDTVESVRRIAKAVERIAPDRVQLNTVVRPPADAAARAVPVEALERFATLFSPRAEVIAAVPHLSSHATTTLAVARNDILALLSRRPCPLDEIASGLGVPRDQLGAHLEALVESGLVTTAARNGVVYYAAC